VKWFDYNFIKIHLDKILREVIRKIQKKINMEGIKLKYEMSINDAEIK
jgi:hypothetical protein